MMNRTLGAVVLLATSATVYGGILSLSTPAGNLQQLTLQSLPPGIRVQLADGVHNLGVVQTDDSGNASLTIGSLSPGPHTITAVKWGTGEILADPLHFKPPRLPGVDLTHAQTYSAGFQTTTAAFADLDGRGFKDVVLAGPAGVSLIHNRDGVLAPPQPLPWRSASPPIAIAINDFNGDGLNDLAITCADGRVAVFLNSGSHSFSPARYYSVGELPSSIASADFNGDGIPDLAIANQGSNNISILLGRGDGTFSQSTVPAGYSPRALVVADFNADGVADLATANFATNEVSILLGDGHGAFPWQHAFAVGNGPAKLIAADFDEDGSTDLAVLNQVDGAVTILLSDQSGGFRTADAIPDLPSFVTGMSAVDVNSDGHLDLLLHAGDQLQVRLGTGAGAFVEGESHPAILPPLLFSFEDLNHDGLAELVLIDAGGEINVFSGSQAVNTANAAFSGKKLPRNRFGATGTSLPLALTPSTIALTSSATPIAFGQTLILTAALTPANATGKVTFFDGTTPLGTRTIVNGQSSMSTSMLPSGVHSLKAYYSGNSGLQLSNSAVLNQTVIDQSIGGFQPSVAYAAGVAPSAVAVADFNNDGKADLAIADAGVAPAYTGSVTVLFGNGDGTFRLSATYATGAGSIFVAVADLNGDGSPDLIVANWGGTVSVLSGKGDGTFSPAINYPVGSNPFALAIADFNGDGNVDVAVANNGDNTVTILVGNGAGSLSAGPVFSAATAPQSIAAGDFNGDGIADLAVAGSDGVAVLLGNGNATFRSAVKYAAHANPYSVALADFNADGKIDIAVANLDSGDVSVLLGNGDGSFKPAANYPSGTNSEVIAVGDFNGDGITDLAVANYGPASGSGGNVSVLYGNGNGAFFAPLNYTAGKTPFFIAAGNLNGDSSSDLVVADVNNNQVQILLGKARTTPAVTIETPVNNSFGGNMVTVSGWAINNTAAVGTPIKSLQVLLDGVVAGNAVYGINRPDVCGTYPGRPNCPNVGYSYALNTAGMSGHHTLTVMAASSDNIPVYGSATVGIMLGSSYSISGQVTVSGQGLSGVAINVNGSQTLSTTTDAAGHYSLAVPANGSYTVAPSRPGYSFNSPVAFSNLTADQTANFTAASVVGQQFYPVTPCRLADTRSGGGFSGPFGPPSMLAGATRTFPLASGGCGIPPNATAYSLNITVVPQGPLGLLTVWPTGQPMPNASTLNSYTGTVVANAAIVQAGSGGAVNVYVNNPTDVILDVTGYFAPPSSTPGLQFYPVMPCRVADTRTGGGFGGVFGPPSMAAGAQRSFPVPSSSCGIPANAAAYAMHITAVPSGPLGLLSAWPTGRPVPNTSILNSYTGIVVSNLAILPAGNNGAITVSVDSPTDVLLDISGYFAPPLPSGLNFYPLSPCRIADTRSAAGFAGPFGPPSMLAGVERSFPLRASACEIPSSAQAYLLNFTAVPPAPLGFLTSWATGAPMPNASTLNSYNGTVVANSAILPAGTNGAISLYVNNPSDVLFDINGYFAP